MSDSRLCQKEDMVFQTRTKLDRWPPYRLALCNVSAYKPWIYTFFFLFYSKLCCTQEPLKKQKDVYDSLSGLSIHHDSFISEFREWHKSTVSVCFLFFCLTFFLFTCWLAYSISHSPFSSRVKSIEPHTFITNMLNVKRISSLLQSLK